MTVKPGDSEYTAHHASFDVNPADYWEWAARRFGTTRAGWQAVLHCGGPVEYNRYIDFVHHQALRPFIISSRGQRVLDLGCGVGRWSTRFAARGARVTGIDLSRTMLHLARRFARARGLGPAFANMTLIHLGLPDDYFDLVACVIVLLHLKQDTDFRDAVREMIRVTRPGGRILILDEIPEARSYNGQVTRHRALEEYRAAVTAAGAMIEQVRYVAASPYRRVLTSILNRPWPSWVKKPIVVLSYAVLGAMDLGLTGWNRIPARFRVEDKLVIIRKP